MNYKRKSTKINDKTSAKGRKNVIAPSITPINQQLPAPIFGVDKSSALSEALQSELNSSTPSLADCLKLVTLMLDTKAFGKVDADGPSDWFDRYLGRTHFSRHLFNGCVAASRIGLKLQIPPTIESFSLLLMLNGVLPEFRWEILQLAEECSDTDIPDAETVLKILNKRDWAKKDKANRDADRLFSRFIQVFRVSELVELVAHLKNEINFVSKDMEGIRALSLTEKQYLLLKIEAHLNAC